MLCSLPRHFTLTLPVCTRERKLVPVIEKALCDKILELPAMKQHSSNGGRSISRLLRAG